MSYFTFNLFSSGVAMVPKTSSMAKTPIRLMQVSLSSKSQNTPFISKPATITMKIIVATRLNHPTTCVVPNAFISVSSQSPNRH